MERKGKEKGEDTAVVEGMGRNKNKKLSLGSIQIMKTEAPLGGK